jgi:O-antigen ligase
MLAVVIGLSLIQLSPLEGIAFVGLLAVVIGALIEPFVGLGAALLLGPLKAYLSAKFPQIPAQVGHAFVALALASWLLRGLSRRDLRIGYSPLLLALLGFLGVALLSLWDAIGLISHGLPELIKWVEIVLLFIFVSEHLAAGKAGRLPSGDKLDPRRGGWLFERLGDQPGAASLRSEAHDERGAGEGVEGNCVTWRFHWLVVVLLGVGVFQAGVGIWQFGLRGEGPEHFKILGGDFFRAYGTFEQPNPYAGYLGLTAALALGVVVEGLRSLLRQRRLKSSLWRKDLPICVLSGGAAGAMLIALVASWSRGAWIGFGAAVLAIAAAVPRKGIWSVLLIAVLVAGGVGLYASGQLPASFVARLTAFVQDIRLEDVRGVPINDANYAVIERLAHWQAALSMFRHRLWTGVGLGCYEPAYPAFALINWPIALGHAHNIYLNLAAETGLMGLLAYLALWGVVLWQTWRVTRRAGGGLMRGLAVGLLGAWTHISVHHLLDNLYVNNVHLHIGVLLGLAAFIVQQTDKTASIHDRQGKCIREG